MSFRSLIHKVLNHGSSFKSGAGINNKHILSIVDEFVINIGDSEDDTLSQIRAIKNPKISLK